MCGILGAQADSHYSIVTQGAKSSQTQDIFHQLVRDTIVQNDDTVMISNMRAASSDTNVILNLAISPGLILTPSSLVILKNPFDGYNNVLTISTKHMKFGKNVELNRVTKLQKQIPSNHQIKQKDVLSNETKMK